MVDVAREAKVWSEESRMIVNNRRGMGARFNNVVGEVAERTIAPMGGVLY